MMADPRAPTPSGARNALRRHLRSSSQSPSRLRRPGDDLLSRLNPATAAEAIRAPTGVLKLCLDQASTSERSFATKTAVASQKIYEWVDELQGWPWPVQGGSTGFEMPPAKRRKLSKTDIQTDSPGGEIAGFDSHADIRYFGSLPADDVALYEKRVDQIQEEMETLDLEEIKNQVLHNHILPLSRPGTPFSDAGLSVASTMSSYTKMEDLTAVVTSLVMQTLPKLSRLSRLLNAWSIRLILLQKVPGLLAMLDDAETALQSGWIALKPVISNSKGLTGVSGMHYVTPAVTRKDFGVIKSVIHERIRKPGRAIDYMLDMLEGMRDTLPDEWLERLETIEKEYARWEIAAERQLQEAEWVRPFGATTPRHLPMQPGTPQPKIQIHKPSPAKEQLEATNVISEDLAKGESELPQPPRRPSSRSYDGVGDVRSGGDKRGKAVLSELNRNVVRASPAQSPKKLILQQEPDSSILEAVDERTEDDDTDDEDDGLELPPMARTRRDSQISVASTVLHGSTSHFFDNSDDIPFREESADPELPGLPDPDEPFSSDPLSPPSSPPLRYKPRSTSVKDTLKTSPSPDQDGYPSRSPLEPPIVFDPDVSYELEGQHGSPSRRSVTSDEDRLQRQIGQILESVPLKIRFNSKATPINLNPPDFQPPSRPPTRPRTSDSRRRSVSSLSSRAGTPSTYSRSGTPSYMLAPVRIAGPRSKSSQEIKVYHLVRSGETPIKLFIRTVGTHNERVMVRVGGGWSDLGEYLREYASHHGRRSRGEGKVEVTDLPTVAPGYAGSSPASRPASAMENPMTPLYVRKARKSLGEESLARFPRTPLPTADKQEGDTPNSETSARSRASSKADWDEESSSLGLAGPKPKKVEMSDESRAWVESVKEKVRIASGERPPPEHRAENKFTEMGKVGSTKRLYRKT